MKLHEVIKKVSGYEQFGFDDNANAVDMWKEWYVGKSAKFHNYTLYNGKKQIAMQRMSLGMAKRVCEDWANLLINEKTDVVLDSDIAQTSMNEILKECRFWQKANVGIEMSFALGNGAFVVSVDNLTVNEEGDIVGDTGKVNVSFINATKIVPITFEDGQITECAFVNEGNRKTQISIHLRDEEGIYKIHNIEADGKGDSLSFTDDDYYVFDTKSTIPWFAMIKPNIANNRDIDSPMGISVFANQIDTLKEIDLVFDSFANEFLLGKKRIFINASQMTMDTKTGEIVDVFDSNDVAFYVLPESDDGSTMIQNDTQTLRVADHQTAIQQLLNLLSYGCGFGTQHYRFDVSGITTATQIISENSEMFRTLKKHEILIQDALLAVFRAIIYASNTFTPVKITSSNIEIKFDDSIIEDKQGEMANDRLDVSMGVMSKAEFRSKWYNEDIETAQQKIEEMSSFTITDPDPYGDGGDTGGQGSQVD